MAPQTEQAWPIPLALLVGLGLTAAPLPGVVSAFRPDWLALILIYQAVHAPHRFVLTSALVIGLLLDALYVTPLGQYALALVISVYLPLRLHQRLVLVPIWQSTLTAVFSTALYQFVLFWCNGATGNDLGAGAYLKPLIANALVWPPLVLLLDTLRHGRPQKT